MPGHHAFQMYAHITWHTYPRVGCVDAAAAVDVRSAVASAGKRSGVEVLRGAVLADHVHLVVSFRPDTRLSDFVRVAKSVAATRANRRVPGTVRWARGYYVRTINRRDLARTVDYVSRQFERHPDLIPRSSTRAPAQLTPGALKDSLRS
jgi:putative transposase